MSIGNSTVSEVVKDAFLKSHRGYSSDEVIISDELNSEFIAECNKRLPLAREEELNWKLITLRKRGQLGPVATIRTNDKYDDFLHASEITARLMYDKYRISVDRVFCDPKLRKEFDSIATSIAPNVPSYLLRKAALKLRKNRQLRPELVPRVAEWSINVIELNAVKVADKPKLVPRGPGIYILRDSNGYLYIGESEDLYTRVKKHLDHSDRKLLAHHFWQNGLDDVTLELHLFAKESGGRIKRNRRAYEADLIRSRRPRLNILL